jgi:hypothetical protein
MILTEEKQTVPKPVTATEKEQIIPKPDNLFLAQKKKTSQKK